MIFHLLFHFLLPCFVHMPYMCKVAFWVTLDLLLPMHCKIVLHSHSLTMLHGVNLPQFFLTWSRKMQSVVKSSCVERHHAIGKPLPNSSMANRLVNKKSYPFVPCVESQHIIPLLPKVHTIMFLKVTLNNNHEIFIT